MARGRSKVLDNMKSRQHKGKWLPGSVGAIESAADIVKKRRERYGSKALTASGPMLPAPPGPADAVAAQKWCRDKAWEAIQALVAVVGDVRAAPAARVGAAAALLDRAYGKPVAPLAVGGIGDAPFELSVRFIPPEGEKK